MSDKADNADTEVTPAPTESPMHRLRVGDQVSFDDNSEWPPVHLEGTISGYGNVEGTYLEVDFDGDTRTLTEDEVKRVG